MAVVIKDVVEMQRLAERLRTEGKRIAVVPTMGYLHEGHLKLIEIAKQHAQIIVTTIFVNPKQFGPSEDFSRYPRNLERDTQLASNVGTDYIFAPATEAMYPSDYHSFLDIEQIADVLEGKARPGHFRGVATVVAKIFNITKPHVAVFGQKDAQQIVVVRQMVRDLNFNIEIVVAPIVREPDGLAMSSRNTYLSGEQRSEAPILFTSLKLAENLIHEGDRNAAAVIERMRDLISKNTAGVVDYISIADAATLKELSQCKGTLLVSLAVRFGSTRLIDNIILHA
ncbi:MAG: Pantothenate synthetase [Bacteroidetes bacterium]|nr:Pantothenate synthetase [Bacteroidota bacterium]